MSIRRRFGELDYDAPVPNGVLQSSLEFIDTLTQDFDLVRQSLGRCIHVEDRDRARTDRQIVSTQNIPSFQ